MRTLGFWVVAFFAVYFSVVIVGLVHQRSVVNEQEASCRAKGGYFQHVRYAESLCLKPSSMIQL